MTFPDDVDGDVLRKLEEVGLDFDQPHSIDFNVDFNSWPPPGDALKTLKDKFGSIEVYEPEGEYDGYVLFTLKELLTNELVIDTQNQASEQMSEFGGVCESWGVSH